MVKIRREGNGTTWLLEGETLPERLDELTEIFKFYSRKDGQTMDPRFMAEVMALQTQALAHMARAQEQEMERLRKVEKDMDALRKEFTAAMQELKAPAQGRLNKPALQPPSSMRKS